MTEHVREIYHCNVQQTVSFGGGNSVLKSERIKETSAYVFIVLITFIVLQSTVVVMHEFTHSTAAWFFGDITSPRDIIWGNFFTMIG